MSSSQDDVLIERLQQTITDWSAEVTGAHTTLTRQIGEAKVQLGTLIETLATNENGSVTVVGSKAGTPANGTPASANIHELKMEIGALQGERTLLRAENEELSRVLDDLQNEAEAGNTALRCMQKELDDLKFATLRSDPEQNKLLLQLNQKASELQRAQLEVGSLTTALEEFKNRSSEDAAPRQADDEHQADMTTAEMFIEDQMHGLKAGDQTINSLEEARDVLREENDSLQENLASENSQAQSLQQALEESAATEKELNEKLEAITVEFQRQSQTLNGTVKELEAHWQRAEESAATEARLNERINALETELASAIKTTSEIEAMKQEAKNELEELRAELHTFEDLLIDREKAVEEAAEKMKNLEETAMAVQQQVAVLLEEHESDTESTPSDEAILKANAKIESLNFTLLDVEAERDTLGLHMLDLDRELSEAQNRLQTEDTRKGETQTELNALLTTLSDIEKERDALTARMQEHEKELVEQQNRLKSDDTQMGEAQAELTALSSALSNVEGERDAFVERIEEQNMQLSELQLRLEAIEAEKAEAQAADEDIPHLFTEAMSEIESLKKKLAQRDAQLAAFHSGDAANSDPSTSDVSFVAHDDSGQRRNMGAILVDAGIINENQLDSALEEQRTAKKRRLGSILVEKGYVREEMVAQVIASQLNLPFIRIADEKIEQGAVILMDGRLATHHMCFPISATSEAITVAMANPLDLIAIEDLGFATSLQVTPVVATFSDIASAIVQHYGVSIANAIVEDNFEHQSPPQAPQKSSTEKPSTEKSSVEKA